MKNIQLPILFAFLILTNVLLAQGKQYSLWTPVDIEQQELSPAAMEKVEAINAEYFNIETNLVSALLSQVKGDNKISIALPIKDESLTEVQLKEYYVMHPKLAERHPNIKTYRGFSEGYSVYLTLSPRGVDAYVKTDDGILFIEPVSSDNHVLHQRYTVQDFTNPMDIFNCGVTELEDEGTVIMEDWAEARSEPASILKYRTAIIATEAYSGRHMHDYDLTLAAVVNLMNGMNSIYVPNMGIQFEMIEESDQLIFTDIEEDPFGEDNTDGNVLLYSNTTVLYNLIGGEAFDVGHVLTDRCSGGFAGVSLGSTACSNSKKGAGVTCAGMTSSNLITTAHEFGHHFSAGHTWSNCPPNMDQYSSITAVEPGSGFTILSYAGACADQNLNIPRVDWFHNKSLDQIITFSREGIGSTCPEEIPLDRDLPVVKINAESGTYIPISTFFELDGEIEGWDGEERVYYNFEQMDIGPISPYGQPEGNAPSFISQQLETVPYRHFPVKNYALAHAFYEMEVLPAYSRDLTFRLTAREGGDGRAVWDEIELHSTEAAGPFRITAPNEKIDHIAGQPLMIEWDVANTDKEPINCKYVDIYYSTNSGGTFNLVAEGVPNIGSAQVYLPARTSSGVRIKVKAANSIFFDYNERSFSIVEPEEPTFALNYGPYTQELCTPTQHEIQINTESIKDYEGEIYLSVSEEFPSDISYEFTENPINPGESTTLILDLSEFRGNGAFFYPIQAASESDTTIFDIGIDTKGNFYDDFALSSPEMGEENVDQAPTFQWVDDGDAEEYLLQVKLDGNDFTPPFAAEVTVTEPEYRIRNLMPKGSVVYWRVQPINECGPGEWSEVRVFKTVQQECSVLKSGDLDIFISPQGTPTIRGPIEIDKQGPALSISVPKIVGDHSWVGELTGWLEAPSGNSVLLWDQECGNGANFNMGFDDASPRDVTCPLSGGHIYKPAEELSSLIGEEVNGTWNLKIKDNVSGEVGLLKRWELEICFESNEVAPVIYRKDIMRVQFDTQRSLREGIGVTHESYIAQDLQFHLINLPQYGTLLYEEDGEARELTVADTFNMQDVYDNKIQLRHDGGEETVDSMKFFVIVPDGGWTGPITLNIRYQEGVVSSTQDNQQSDKAISVWPSPAKDLINFHIEGNPEEGEWLLLDMNGREIHSMKVENSMLNNSIDVSNFNPGMYILKWNAAQNSLSTKVIIQ